MINSFRREYRFLSNFYPSVVLLDGMQFPAVEYAFQAAKTLDMHERVNISLARSANDAKRLGRSVKLRNNWNELRLEIMEDLLRQKFTMYSWLRQDLIATGDEHLEEGNTWGDRYWGTVNGVGENHLGILLMKIREELKSAA